MPVDNGDGTKSYSLEEIQAMDKKTLAAVWMKRVKVKGTMVVRDKETGKIRYDDPSLAGQYNEDKLKDVVS